MKIIVDSRESRSSVPRNLVHLGYSTEVQELELGDYASLDGRVLVERKEVGDFVASIQDGRLFGQAELLANCEFPTIIVEGDFGRIYSLIDPESIAGALAALGVFYKIPLIATADSMSTARVVGRIIKHASEGLGYEIPLRVSKPKVDGARSQYLVEGLPSVGPETARKLLDHFGTASSVFSASTEDLLKVKGIGKKTAEGIVAALGFKPTSYRTTKSRP
jgi:Fanconi anemia group M protein